MLAKLNDIPRSARTATMVGTLVQCNETVPLTRLTKQSVNPVTQDSPFSQSHETVSLARLTRQSLKPV